MFLFLIFILVVFFILVVYIVLMFLGVNVNDKVLGIIYVILFVLSE